MPLTKLNTTVALVVSDSQKGSRPQGRPTHVRCNPKPEDVKQELGSILQYLQTPPPGMDPRPLADATSKMVEHAMHR